MVWEVDQDGLVVHWTLVGDDLDRVAGKRDAAKLGFALLLKLVQSLRFRSNNTMHAPIIDGGELVRRYADSSTQTYRRGEQVPIRGVVGGDWLELLY
ncbi:hypothetical protein SAMN04487904_1209 [Actinopolyspora lacussalsi subsp. righensis]|uniref:Uncharacterized protein n=1 Tax=Actinopolyspora righensis TaxID=995060 RepID=A0A1I6X1T5_9ACTN|nr:hypothetical protein [Actinopolyspora righensis]SFT32230.1 hypothetical protein SAMN04487904_1011 [Actinopolyspora righensis]SFT93717.1 hypothetical protein SAMN04487904_1141 [Actinopolyspora righensis]SFT98331.1 hypothetical protein SAMN04487904_1209 [Actinopolyspora righensis]